MANGVPRGLQPRPQRVLGKQMGRFVPLATMLPAGVLVLIACNLGGSAQTPDLREAGSITARVCTDGDGREAVLYVQNLDEFEWGDVRIEISKGGETYSQERGSLPPQNQVEAEPFTESREFFYYVGGAAQQPGGRLGQGFVRQSDRYNLGSFSHIESVSVDVQVPFEAAWTGEVVSCE